MSENFISSFYQYQLPEPGVVYPDYPGSKNDLKLLLEIATKSRLKQGQEKKPQIRQVFYCKNVGKQCFKINVDFTPDGSYIILDNYSKMKHKYKCEQFGEDPKVLQIYNLMMLKKDDIEKFMIENDLQDGTPQQILHLLSNPCEASEYFYNKVVHNLDDRRKLKKRFDNIINVGIKKKREEQEQEQEQEQLPKKSTKLTKAKTRESQKQNTIKMVKGCSIQELCEQVHPRKLVKTDNKSIFYSKESLAEQKQKSEEEIYYEEQSNFDIEIALNRMQDRLWPSNNSIVMAIQMGERERMDDLFASIRNSLLKSLEKKSLREIQPNITDYRDLQ